MRQQQRAQVLQTMDKIMRINYAILSRSTPLKEACRANGITTRTYYRYTANDWAIYKKYAREFV